MKRLLYTLLLAIPLVLVSCSNDDDLPDVNMSIDYSGATDIEDVLYVIQGDELSIDAINIEPAKGTGKATIGATAYYWNYQYLGTTIEEPFGMKVDTRDMDPGDYLLQINATVYQVDRSVGMAYFTFPVKIVADAAGIPGDATGSGRMNPDIDIRVGVEPTR